LVQRLDSRQLTGRDESHLVALPDGHQLQAEVAQAFNRLQGDARAAGFDLVIASGFRSYARQLAIWNGKVGGQRPVHDDQGRAVDLSELSTADQLRAILRYSAIPGTSRHHWGTDLDIYDAGAMAEGYQLQLSPVEVAAGGIFDPLHRWLDERMAAGESHGFYRPYGADRGGVAPERWHLSYAPLAVACGRLLNPAILRACWAHEEAHEALRLSPQILAALPDILSRYVAVPANWCPAPA